MKHIAANRSQHLRRPMPVLLRLMMAAAVVFSFLSSASAQTATPPSGSGTEGDPYLITVLGNLVWMGDTVTSSSGNYYKLMNDIDASETASWDGGKGFLPIGNDTTPFKGTFDGNNKKITGLTIDRPDTNYIGLFGRTYFSSTIKNLGLEDFTIAGRQFSGGLVGLASGSISNCYSTGDVSGRDYCGGLVGQQWSGSISNCYSSGSVSATGSYSYCGGLVGQQWSGSISNCYSSGSVSATGSYSYCGGLVGLASGSISNCYSSVRVSGSGDCGGLVGYQGSGSINNCYSSGSVSGRWSCGGLVGSQGGSINNCYSTGSVNGSGDCGGLVGYQGSGSINNCYSTGRVSGRWSCGGLVGEQSGGSISNCYSTGDIRGTSGCGGLVGSQQGDGSISNCYSMGSVRGIRYCGGLVGYQAYSSISNCYSSGSVSGTSNCGGLVGYQDEGAITMGSYYDTETSGQNDTGKGTPKTTAEMKQQGTFSGWDFADVWKIVEGTSYPYLRVFDREDCDLTLSVIGQGTIVPEAGVTAHSYGAVVSLSAVAADNCVFLEWIGGSVADPTSSNTTVLMDSSKSVTAHFRKTYEIRTLSELQAVNDDLDGHYILMNDIDASETATWDGGKGFTPIGSETTPFEGIFDGNNKKITGLTIDRPNTDYVGLFGRSYESTVKNLGLEDFTIAGAWCCGGLVGSQVGGSISNCYSSGSVSGTSDCGGLVGSQVGGSISNCYSSSSVSGTGWYCGGLVGYQAWCAINDCYSTGNVRGSSRCGGLVGEIYYGNISNCYSTDSARGTYYCGGLVGYQGSGSVSNCYSTGRVRGDNYCGGLVGYQGYGSISNSYYDRETGGQRDTGKGTPKTTAEMKRQATFSGWDFANVWKIVEGTSYPYLRVFGREDCDLTMSVVGPGTIVPVAGVTVHSYGTVVSLSAVAADNCVFVEWIGGSVVDPTSSNTTVLMDSSKSVTAHFRKVYEIRTLSELQAVNDDLDGHYTLMNDIDASETASWDSGKGFIPIGSDATPFEGVFDGNNKKITGLTIDRPDRHYVGLFGKTHTGSTIKNLGLEDFTIIGDQNCGGLVGSQVGGSMSNCYSSGSVSGAVWYCGGLVGSQEGGSISNCYSSGSVRGNSMCGGLVGHIEFGNISNCCSTGDIRGTSHCGGLVGQQVGGSISNCYSTGSVSGSDWCCGGLVGSRNFGTVNNCYYDRETSGQSDTGKGTPKTTAEMKEQATFSGWDFASIWGIKEKESYPYLVGLTPLGSLQVTLVPAEAVTAGAQWSINGGVTWHDSAATVTGLPVADYTVTYKTTLSWDAPAPVSVTVTEGATTAITGTYALKSFTITSNCGPNGTISPKGVFSVNYGSNKTYTITPNEFCAVREVKVDGVNVGALTSYTFTNVTENHTIVATFYAPLDIVLQGGDFTAGTDTSLAPGAAVDLSWTVSASQPVSDPVWFEVFGSRTGGFDQVRTGAALTSSYKKQDGLGTSATVKPGTLKLNPVPDGLYTLVPSVNRGNLSGTAVEIDYTNNWLPIAGKRLSVHNPNLSDIDLVLSDVDMQYDPAFPTRVTFRGKIWNAGSENLVKPGCWIEVFYGTLTAEAALMPQGTIGAGVKIETLAAGSSAAFTLSGTVPAGVQNCALAVVADSTDIVPEIDETNNVYLAYDPSILPAGKTNGVDLVITDMTVDEAQLAPHSVAPGEKLNFTVTVWNRGTVTPSQKVYLEMFASQDGGLSNVAGVTVTWSEQITPPALGETKTYALSKTLNSIGDGMYTLVATVNRTALAANPGDETPLDNRLKYAAGRIFLKTPPVSGTNNIEWVSGPTFTQNGTQMTVAGTIKNTGTAATRAFWTEAFIGTMQAKTGVFYKDTNLVFCAGDNCPGLAAGATKQITLTGTVPPGKVVGVLADSTDVVAETDETDNYDYSGLTN